MRAVSTRARCLHGTPLGLPVVPLVYQRTAVVMRLRPQRWTCFVAVCHECFVFQRAVGGRADLDVEADVEQLRPDLRHRCRVALFKDQAPRAGIAQHVHDLRRRQPEIERHQDRGAVFGRGIRLVVFEAVHGKDGDAILAPETEPGQRRREPARARCVARVSESPPVADERFPLREVARIAVEQVADGQHRVTAPGPDAGHS